MKYLVIVPEVHYSHRAIEAASSEAAIEKVKNGEGEEIACEYSHTLMDGWRAEETPATGKDN